MNSECVRIAGQLTSAFTADPWHGPPLRELLTGLTAVQASNRPLPSAHTIWELVLHVITWVDVPHQRLGGTPRTSVADDEDWPRPPVASDAACPYGPRRINSQPRRR